MRRRRFIGVAPSIVASIGVAAQPATAQERRERRLRRVDRVARRRGRPGTPRRRTAGTATVCQSTRWRSPSSGAQRATSAAGADHDARRPSAAATCETPVSLQTSASAPSISAPSAPSVVRAGEIDRAGAASLHDRVDERRPRRAAGQHDLPPPAASVGDRGEAFDRPAPRRQLRADVDADVGARRRRSAGTRPRQLGAVGGAERNSSACRARHAERQSVSASIRWISWPALGQRTNSGASRRGGPRRRRRSRRSGARRRPPTSGFDDRRRCRASAARGRSDARARWRRSRQRAPRRPASRAARMARQRDEARRCR